MYDFSFINTEYCDTNKFANTVQLNKHVTLRNLIYPPPNRPTPSVRGMPQFDTITTRYQQK